MRRKIATVVSMAFVLSFGLLACSNSSRNTTAEQIEGLDQLGNITVITREEGSGTRGIFAEKVNLENTKDSSSADQITSNAQIVMNADAVIEAVSQDENAIGYVSLGSVTNEVSGVKVIGVNGILPDSTTIEDDKYPLSRNFNIAYSGQLSAAGNDFLNYILSAGQDIVSIHYTSVKKATDFLSDQSTGELFLSGSSSAAPLLKELASDYNEKYNENIDIKIQISDSTSGLTSAMQGSSDWGVSSRELKDYEKELLSYETIAKDGVAVIVNESNPAQSLTVAQLTKIFDGTAKEWKNINE